MVLRIATWNAEGMFVAGTMTRRASPRDAVDVIQALDADIVVIPEFGMSGQLDPETRSRLETQGYRLIEVAYDQPDIPDYSMTCLTRLPLKKIRSLRLIERSMIDIEVMCDSTPLRVLGVHLDDRSSKLRQTQITELRHYMQDIDSPIVLLGDFNAMSKEGLFSWFARVVCVPWLTRLVPFSGLRSVLERVHEMADGTTIAYVHHTFGLMDYDQARNQPTVSARQRLLDWLPSWRLAKIDWIFGSTAIIKEYKVWRDVGSDHRPVCASVEFEHAAKSSRKTKST